MPHLTRFLLCLGLALAGVLSRAADSTGGFLVTLSLEQQAAAGLTRLNAEEQTALNTLVARELMLARQGNVRGFAGTFISRRKPAEMTQAGLDRLTPEEQARLNAYVATALASAPMRPEPKPLTKKDVTSGSRLQVHGRVSFAYGWGSGGRSFRGGSVYTDIYDPETGLSLGIGLSATSGNGWWPYCYDDDYYGYDAYDRDLFLGTQTPTPFTDFRGEWIENQRRNNRSLSANFSAARFDGSGSCFRRH